MIVRFLAQAAPGDPSVATSMRQRVVGGEISLDGEDDMERALIALAVDAYPACLLPIRSALSPEIQNYGPSIGMWLFRHPQSRVFADAVLNDDTLQNAFEDDRELADETPSMLRNTLDSNDLQASLLAELLLQSAWRKLITHELTRDAFVAAAVEQLRLVRDVFAGKLRTLTAKFAFTGILLPPGQKLELSDGLIRATSEAERRFVPASLRSKHILRDASGAYPIINNDGDVVLEHALSYKMQERPFFRPQVVIPRLAMAQSIMRLRYSLMLAVKREYRVHLIQTWRAYDVPLKVGFVLSWDDPQQGPAFRPTQLTSAEAEAWREWYETFKKPHVVKIELALTRILRAISERSDPSDVLIDSVIAWENLFGTKEGEPTFRVTMCLAKLLEQTPEARVELRTRLAKIYALRSKIVHGGGELRDDEWPRCSEALEIAIRAVEVLLTTREDILKLPDGAQRGTTLLLGP